MNDYVERIFRPKLGDKFRHDFSDGYNSFGTFIDKNGIEWPAVVPDSAPGDGTHFTVWCDHAFAKFEYSGGFAKYEYNYGDKKWRKIGGG